MAHPPDTDLQPREFLVGLLMAATWYFAGPWGLLPTLWFLALITNTPMPWERGAKLLPVQTRRALAERAQQAQAAWQQLTGPWREAPATPGALPASWDDADPLGGPAPTAAPALPAITLAELAAAPNILLVGSPGSGKSTLLHALIAARPWRCYVLDPHNHPAKWPARAAVIGGGRDFPAIYGALQRAEGELDTRAKRLNGEAGVRFAPFSLAGDEWGSIASEIAVPKDGDSPGRLLTRLLKEGRKFGISFLGAAHGDTAASLGSSGDTAAFRYSFDWIIYLGGFVATQLKDQPQLVGQLPLGRTPEGKSFPLIVVASSPLTGERRLLDLRGLGQATADAGASATVALPPDTPRPAERAETAPTPPAERLLVVADPRQQLLTRLLDAPPAPPVAAPPPAHPPAHPPERPPVVPPQDRAALIRLLLAQGWTVTQIRDMLRGTSAEIGALVRRIEDELYLGGTPDGPHRP